MTIEQLRDAAQARPFKPFDVCLADGQRVPVPSSEFLFIPPKASRTFVVFRTPEAYRVIDLLLVTSLELNGKSSRRRQRTKG